MLKERVQEILKHVKYRPNWYITVVETNNYTYLQVSFYGDVDARGLRWFQHGRKWLLSPHMTTSEVVQTAWLACAQAEDHEARERFKFKGHAVYGPHFNVEGLAKLCSTHGLDVRK